MQLSPDLLPAIAAFARVAHHKSFSRAAEEMGVSASAVSQSVRNLEARLGVRLLERTTRRVEPTDAGTTFLNQARPALESLNGAVTALDDTRKRPTGLLRLNVSRLAADALLLPHLPAFQAACPDVTVELHCDNQMLDLVAGGFDAGIRLHESLLPGVVSVPLGGLQRTAVFASPDYVKRHGAPRVPQDLQLHPCVNMRLSTGSLYRWEFARGRRQFDMAVTGPVIANDIGLLVALVEDGVGIGCSVEIEVRRQLASGRLVPLLQSWWPRFPGFHLYFSSRAQQPRKLRAFIDFMKPRIDSAFGMDRA